MEPPPTQSFDVSTNNFHSGNDDPQDKAINECCSCCYDCSGGCLDYLFCNFC